MKYRAPTVPIDVVLEANLVGDCAKGWINQEGGSATISFPSSTDAICKSSHEKHPISALSLSTHPFFLSFVLRRKIPKQLADLEGTA